MPLQGGGIRRFEVHPCHDPPCGGAQGPQGVERRREEERGGREGGAAPGTVQDEGARWAWESSRPFQQESPREIICVERIRMPSKAPLKERLPYFASHFGMCLSTLRDVSLSRVVSPQLLKTPTH